MNARFRTQLIAVLLVLGAVAIFLMVGIPRTQPIIVDLSPSASGGGSNQCRAIFTLTTDGVDQSLLTQLLPHLHNVELAPTHKSIDPSRIFRDGLGPTYDERHKSQAMEINQVLSRGHIFAETNPLFSVTYLDVAMDLMIEYGCRIDIIVLREYLLEVFARLQATGPFDGKSSGHYGHQNAISRLTVPRDGVGNGDLGVLYYLLDAEARVQYYQQVYERHPNVHWHSLRVERLADVDRMRQLATAMDLSWRNETNLQELSCTHIQGALRSDQEQQQHDEMRKTTVQEDFRRCYDSFSAQNIFVPAHVGIVPLPQFSAKALSACAHSV